MFNVGNKVRLKTLNEVYLTTGEGNPLKIGNTYTIMEDCGMEDPDYYGYYSIDNNTMVHHSDLELIQ